VKKNWATSKVWLLVLANVLVMTLWLSGCGAVGNDNTATTPSTSVAMTSAPPSTLATGGTAVISATVSNDSSNGGVDWSCAPAGSCGSFNPSHTASGANTTYTAPTTAGSVTITATSTTTHSATAVATVTVNAAAVTVTMGTKPPASMQTGATATVAATVANDSANGGVDWTCAPAGTCGSFSAAHTASGANTTYTAPAAAGTVTITATSTSTHSATAAATVTVTASTPAVTVTMTTKPTASLQVGTTATAAATVANDTANAGVDWSCTPAGTCGTFNPAHTASGANTTYAAPAAAVNAVITATSTSTHSATATTNVSVVVATSTISLSAGSFSFNVAGEDAKKNTIAIAGSVILDASGNVTGGEQDYVSNGGATSPQPGGDKITGGKLTLGTNGVGSLTVVTNNANVGVAGTETFRIAVANSKHGLISEFDASATSSGSIDLQTLGTGGLAQINGPFAWQVTGKSGSSVEETFGGLLTADGAGNLHVTVDVNDNGAGERAGSNVGTYTAPDASGRGTMSVAGTAFVYYIVNSKVLRLATVSGGEPDLGSAYAGVSGVSNATLNQKFFFTDSSNLSSGAAYSAAGQITFDGNGHVSGFADVNENGHVTSAAFTGTYTVASTGYSSVTITPGNTQDISTLGLYLTDPSVNFADPNASASAGGGLCGVIIDLDTKLVGSGSLIIPGTGTPSGNFAVKLQASNTNNEVDSVGVASISGTAITGAQDINDLFNAGQKTALATSGTLTADTTNAGRFTTQLSVATTPASTLKFAIYEVSSTQLVDVELDTTQFGAGLLEQQH
jgi:hypothetical protein